MTNLRRPNVGSSAVKLADNIKIIENKWRDKVVQYQVAVFSESTKGDKLIRFDDVIADALELGALRTKPLELTEEQRQWLAEKKPEDVPLKVAETVLEYYLANKPADTDWCVLPITNIDAFLGSTSLGKTYMSQLTSTVLEKKANIKDVSIVKMLL